MSKTIHKSPYNRMTERAFLVLLVVGAVLVFGGRLLSAVNHGAERISNAVAP